MSADELKSFIRDVPDFPKAGIVFKDITPLLRDPVALEKTVRLLAEPFHGDGITSVAAIESRGFIFGSCVARILNCGLYDPGNKIPDVKRWLAVESYADAQHRHDHAASRHDAHIRAFALTTQQAIPAAAFDTFMDLLGSLHGPKLLRLKGMVKLAEHPDQPVVVHAVQHLMHPVARLAGWPEGDRLTRMVFIVRDIEPRVITELFDALLGPIAPDLADYTAIADNPLVPFGGIDR